MSNSEAEGGRGRRVKATSGVVEATPSDTDASTPHDEGGAKEEERPELPPGQRKNKVFGFRFTPRDVELLDRAMERAGTESQIEAIRNALRFYVGEFRSPVDGATRDLIRAVVRDEIRRLLRARGAQTLAELAAPIATEDDPFALLRGNR